MERQGVHRLAVGRHRPAGRRGQRAGRARRGHQPAPAVAVGHRRETRDEVAEVVRQVDVVALLEPVPGEVAVLSERDLLGEVQPQRIRSQALRRLQRIDHRPERLAHLPALPVHPAVAEDLARQRQAGAHQHRGPADAVEARDVLPDDVQVGRPPGLEQRLVGAVPDPRNVVDERVDPDVDHAVGIPRNRYAPRLAGPAHRDVFEPRFEQPEHLVAADLRLQELGMGLVVVEQPPPVLRQPEEVVLLLDPLRRPAVHRTVAAVEVLLRLERLARNAVPPLVPAVVDVPGGGQALSQGGHAGPVARFRRADEVVERDVEPRPYAAERLLHLVAEGERRNPELARPLEDVLRVLVVAHQEAGLDAAQPLVPRNDVGRDLLVGGPQVGPAVDVVDRRGEIEPGHRVRGPLPRSGRATP